MLYETVIGLEIHVQLKTESKLFSGASTKYGQAPNTQACAIDLALPGTLPVVNEKAILLAVKFGLAVGANVRPTSVFARKNYFYPDLPKGYQTSQFELPIVEGGYINIKDANGSSKKIRITRAHLEEDAGKLVHDKIPGHSAVDLNRAGTPLLEIVSEPDLSSAEEAVAYMKSIHQLVRFLDISDGNMEEGSFRCDANVSVRPKGQEKLGTRSEIKNLNSFKFIEQAIEYEVDRQIDILSNGQSVVQETRLYDSVKKLTRSMRSKEEAHDYRYFPCPDLLPVVISEDYINTVKNNLPELPEAKYTRYTETMGLSGEEATFLIGHTDICIFFESVVELSQANAKTCYNWIGGEWWSALNRESLTVKDSPITPAMLANLLDKLENKTLSGKMAKQVFQAMFAKEGSVDEIIEKRGLKQVNDTETIDKMIHEIIEAHPKAWAEFKDGQDKLLGFFVGQLMKASKGQVNPKQANERFLHIRDL